MNNLDYPLIAMVSVIYRLFYGTKESFDDQDLDEAYSWMVKRGYKYKASGAG